MTAPAGSPVLSHGTVESADINATREFYEDFLGLSVIRPLPPAIYASAGGDWSIVCVSTKARLREQSRDNRFCLHVSSAAEVDRAHGAALRHADRFGMRIVEDPAGDHAARSFVLQDRDNVWWEVACRSARPLDNT